MRCIAVVQNKPTAQAKNRSVAIEETNIRAHQNDRAVVPLHSTSSPLRSTLSPFRVGAVARRCLQSSFQERFQSLRVTAGNSLHPGSAAVVVIVAVVVVVCVTVGFVAGGTKDGRRLRRGGGRSQNIWNQLVGARALQKKNKKKIGARVWTISRTL